MQTKTCTTCGEEKELTEFHKQKLGKYGVKSRCKVCTYAYMQEYERRPEVQERKREYQRECQSRPEIREKKREYMREYLKRPEYRSYMHEYRRRPETRERDRTNRQDPDQIERKRKRNNEDYRLRKESGLVSNKRIEVTKKYATRKGRWSDAEVKFLMASELPLVDIALELGRTYGSVQTKRDEMRRKLEAQQ